MPIKDKALEPTVPTVFGAHAVETKVCDKAFDGPAVTVNAVAPALI